MRGVGTEARDLRAQESVEEEGGGGGGGRWGWGEKEGRVGRKEWGEEGNSNTS